MTRTVKVMVVFFAIFIWLGLPASPVYAAISCDVGTHCTNWTKFCACSSGGGCGSQCSNCCGADFSGNCSCTLSCDTCTPDCTPSCSAPFCGQGNGCGGTCSSSDRGNYGAWTCSACYDPGGCGTHDTVHDCTRSDPCGGTDSKHEGCGNSVCDECGPHYGVWSACTAPSFSRSRQVLWDCRGPSTDTETCYGSIYGTLFDASVVENCSTIATQPKVEGTGVTATATVNHTSAYSTTTDTAGNYTRGSLLVPDTYSLTYSVDSAKWVASPPKLLCDGPLAGISLTDQGQSIRRRIGLWRIYGGWFQAEGGDLYGATGISTTIPATCALPENQISCGSYTIGGEVYTPLIRDAATGNLPGSAISGSGSVDLGGGGPAASNAVISSQGWKAGSSYDGKQTGYDYFMGISAHYAGGMKKTWDGTGKPTGSDNHLYETAFDTALTLTGSISPDAGGESIVIFHGGDVDITGDITVPVGSYLAVIAKGKITIEPEVQNVQGVYIADTIQIPSSGNKASEVKFTGEGTFVGWNGVLLARDRGITNNAEPSENFVFRPDFVVNAPFGLRLPQIRWKEVNP